MKALQKLFGRFISLKESDHTSFNQQLPPLTGEGRGGAGYHLMRATTLWALVVICFLLACTVSYAQVAPTPQLRPLNPALLRLLNQVEPCDDQITYGQTVAGNIQQPGQACRYIFSGQAGEQVTIRMTRSDESLNPQFDLLDPNGAPVASGDDAVDAPNRLLYAYALPQTGLYTIVARGADPQSVGPFNLVLGKNRCGGNLTLRETIFAETGVGAPACGYLLRAAEAMLIRVTVHALDGGSPPQIGLLQANGRVVKSPLENNERIALPAAGRYRLIVWSTGERDRGPFQLTVNPGLDFLAIQTTCGSSLEFDEPISSNLLIANIDCDFTFVGNQNEVVTIRMSRIDLSLTPTIRLLAADGSELSLGRAQGTDAVQTIRGYRLPSSGEYTVVAGSYNGESAGRFTLSLTLGNFAVDEVVRNAYNATNDLVNLRRTPGYRNKASTDVLVKLPVDASLTILGAAQRVDDLTWWPVRYTTPGNQSYTGWVAERTVNGQTILAPLP
jgi:hypothetical protein